MRTTPRRRHGAIGFGKTEDEAIKDLAVKMNVPLWNETEFIV